MVIEDHERAAQGARQLGLLADVSHERPEGIPHCFGAAIVISGPNNGIEVVEKIWREGNARPGHVIAHTWGYHGGLA